MEDSQSRRDRDPYGVLGVPADATAQEITRAYRRAAHLAHPDAQPQDPQAAARFHALTEAYETLSDPGRRADYDRLHPAHHQPWRPAGTGAAFTAPRASAARPSYGQPIWAGPVHVQPPGEPPAEQGQGSAPAGSAHHRDPDVYLPGEMGWPW